MYKEEKDDLLCAQAALDTVHSDSVWHPLHTKEGDEISMFLVPCLWGSISTFSGIFFALFFAMQLALVSMITVTLISSLSVFSCREQGVSVPAESKGAPSESKGYTLRCSGDLLCGYLRGCRGEEREART